MQGKVLPEEDRWRLTAAGCKVLMLANEGKIVCVVPEAEAGSARAAMRGSQRGAHAACIGRVAAERPGRVIMQTVFGGKRIVDMPVGEQLPQIC